MIHFLFDGPPGPEGPRFIESETPDGRPINAGEWHERPDGLWELRVATSAAQVFVQIDAALTEACEALIREEKDKARKKPGSKKNSFSDEEIAAAINYRQGVIDGLRMAGKIAR